MTFPPSTQATEVLQPSELELNLPSTLEPLKFAPDLGLGPSVTVVRRDQLHPALVGQLGVEPLRVVGLVTNTANGEVSEGLFGYTNFCRCASGCYEVGTCVLWHKAGFQDGVVWTKGTRTTFKRTNLSCSSYPNSPVGLIHFGLYAPDTPASVR